MPRPPDVETIALTFKDGSVGIMSFITTDYDDNGVPRWSKPPTEQNIQKEIDKSMFPQGAPVSWRLIDRREVPQDRIYRNALVDKDRKLQFDMPKAREIHRERMRAVRNEKLALLDIEMVRAMELPGTGAATRDNRTQEIATKKQRLRDVTDLPEIESAQTIEELRAVWPDYLNG